MVRMSVDAATGQPRIERLLWVDDAGLSLQPDLVRDQLMGGAAQGIGQALMEQVVYDGEGQLLTGSLMDYAVPRADDMPPIELHSLHTPSPLNPLGAKGVGEAGCIGVPAAIMNAARDALSPLGEVDLQLPLRAEQLWHALQAATPGDKP
jgi:carbon-monoxide dehydrogenase large subunit